VALVNLCVPKELHAISYLFGSKLGSFKHRDVLSFSVLSKFGAMLLSSFCITFGLGHWHFEEAFLTFFFAALAVNELVVVMVSLSIVTSEVDMVGFVLVFAGKACEVFVWHWMSG